MVALFRPGAQATPQLVPLQPHDVAALRRPVITAFSARALREHVAHHPDLAWRTPDGSEYIVGGWWRRREDVGTVEELVGRRNAVALLERLLAAHGAAGARLVVLSTHECGQRERFYLDHGFQHIDHIVRMEKLDARVLRELPARPARLRVYQDADCAAVLEVERHSFDWLWWNSAAELQTYAHQPAVRIVVAEVDGQIVGYSGCTVSRRDGHLDRLAVHRAWQGHGIGELLLVEALRWMQSAGARWIGLTTQTTNYAAQALYQKHGFVRTAIEVAIVGRWLRAVP